MRPKNLWLACIAFCISHISYAQTPQLISAMINGCGANDGAGEYLIVYSGPTSFTANSTTINIRHASNTPPATTITDTFDDNSGNHVTNYVASLNASLPVSGCSDLNFVVGIPGVTIPAGSHILIVNAESSGAITTTVFDFDGWCGNGMDDVYVFLSRDTSWPTNGKFANQPGNTRYFTSTINTTTTNFNYFNGWSSDADGNYVAWNDGGGAAPIYSNYPNCSPTDTQSLPVKLLYFRGAQINNVVKLEWATANEENNSHFEIQRSTDGFNWNHLAYIEGGGSSKSELTYQYTDQAPLEGRSFYRLIQQDFSGLSETFEAISIWIDKKDFLQIYPNPGFGEISIVSETDITQVIACDSKGNVFTIPAISKNKFDVSALSPGLYFLSISTHTETRQRSFIISDN